MAKPLYRSSTGEVACATHAPKVGSDRWNAEGWQPVSRDPHWQVRQCAGCDRLNAETAQQPTGESLPLVLSVDDREDKLYVRNRLLRAHGFRVTDASSAKDVVHLARTMRPHLILLDIHMRDGDGRDVCQRLKDDPEVRAIPVVLISATLTGNRDYVEAVGWAGADAFISEPVDDDSLISTLRAVLDGG